MTKNKWISALSLALTAVMLLSLAACGAKSPASPGPAQTEAPADPAAAPSAETAVVPEPVTHPERQPGERFEGVISLEGMEEKVRYEHIRNDALGFAMDYDYERFERSGEADRECFVSVWDDPDHPENYLEVTAGAEIADIAANRIREQLSEEYDLLVDRIELSASGMCTRIEASEIKGTGHMADQLQTVYVIPAEDGCRIAAAHYSIEAAEGFAKRFRIMLNTFTVFSRNTAPAGAEQALAGVWQTASMALQQDGSMAPEYHVLFRDGQIHYGRLEGQQFYLDHSDTITLLQETGTGVLVQAQAGNGVKYSYRTAENDPDVLEYYETWNEAEFPDMYRGGASLSRCG